MSSPTCSRCGAPIALADEAVTCPYCGAVNAPAPKEVMVAVPVQIIQNVVRPGDAGIRELRCPRCKKKLVGVKVEGVELDGCPGCGGIWIDNASAAAILAAPKAVFSELASRAGRNAVSSGVPVTLVRPACASCPAILDRVEVRGVILDVCAEHGTWFDAYELATLTDTLLAPPPAAPTLPRGEVKCTKCGTTMKAEEATIGEAGLVCDACWRKRQGELVAEGDSLAYQRGGGEIAKAAGKGVADAATTSARGSRGVGEALVEGMFDAITSNRRT
jgi:Zn-finger nucleic acid-binding protein/Zn finger protein HypA/HybF involved in hydrogenase expression